MKNKKRKNNSISNGKRENIKRSKACHNSNDLEFKNIEIENNIINEKFEIIKLTEFDEEDDDDDDCQWEDVSELSEIPEIKDIVINMNEICSEDESKDIKRKGQQIERENNQLIKRTLLVSLFARSLYINKICSTNTIKHLAISCMPYQFIDVDSTSITLVKLHEMLCLIKSQFCITDDFFENGIVFDILVKGLEHKKISASWINIIILVIMRSVGFHCRLVSTLYPEICINDNNLCLPTTYRASTRNYTKNKKRIGVGKKQSVRIPTDKSPHIIFSIEVLDEENRRWVPIDIRNPSTFDNVAGIVEDYPRFLYVIGIDNDGHVKDLASRYDTNWAESSRRLRLSRVSWDNILAPFIALFVTDVDRLEDEAIRSDLLSRGLPRTLADFKGHPLFVLKRNLLKYEVIHPPDVTAVGQFNGEDVYLRDNVKMAHTRETWLKEALVVKDGEIPCKKVNTMMSRRKQKSHGTDPSVDIFGPWQVEKYIPPKAKDGIVPINSHGNVDLFKPCMVPDGCVHIRLKGIDKVAKNLNINYASAMVGFGFVKGNRAIPILDGWVVCRENVKVLTDALHEWNRIEAVKRYAERQRVVVKRWEILTRRILIRERLRIEYNF